ncbi:MAG TPA: phosphate ABC transporter substrate-binding protein PstS [Candidatus Limnocylindria bacterium]|jgi:phosphate transport system substrate-binding protein|nr:phosphate ABC transporter substrate-binding protein PstS [Candidatus Limnocylindria bacterium]
MKKPVIATLIVFATMLSACGGATPAGTSASTGGATAAANPCAVPVKAKCPDEASELTGAGATFPAPIYTKWVSEYNKLTGIQINYQPVGSGGGIKSLTDKTVDYGATDGPMTEAQLAAAVSPVLHVPMVMGAVVPTYNLPGVTAPLKFTPDVLAGIYLEQIKKWNDPKIASLNAGVTLPDLAITTVHRSDGSGTTYVWTDYLSKVSAEWKSKVGFANSVSWPGGLGASGNAGVAGAVKNSSGAIGYVELIYAIQNKLGYGNVQNAKGKYIEATLDSVTKAAEGVTLPADLRVSITNSENEAAWPISTFTWTLAYTEIPNKAKAIAIARFFWWSTHEGQAFAKDLGYAPLPATVVTKAEEKIRAITSGGTAVLPK